MFVALTEVIFFFNSFPNNSDMCKQQGAVLGSQQVCNVSYEDLLLHYT